MNSAIPRKQAMKIYQQALNHKKLDLIFTDKKKGVQLHSSIISRQISKLSHTTSRKLFYPISPQAALSKRRSRTRQSLIGLITLNYCIKLPLAKCSNSKNKKSQPESNLRKE